MRDRTLDRTSANDMGRFVASRERDRSALTAATTRRVARREGDVARRCTCGRDRGSAPSGRRPIRRRTGGRRRPQDLTPREQEVWGYSRRSIRWADRRGALHQQEDCRRPCRKHRMRSAECRRRTDSRDADGRATADATDGRGPRYAAGGRLRRCAPAASSASRSASSSHGTASCCSPRAALRARGATVRASTSRSPRTSMYGTFCSWARRILFCIRLSESSTSTRRPRARRTPASSSAASMWRSAIGMTTAWTGASQSGNAPGEMLDEDADEPLERAVDGAMDGDRALRLAVLVDVGQVEPLGQHDEVDLDRRHLPFAARARRRCRCRSWARRTCRPSASAS